MVGLVASCALLPQGYALTVVSDGVEAGLLLLACVGFAKLGLASKGRMRWFWLLQAGGWVLWLGDQIVWIVFDLVLQEKMPPMYAADALLFLAGAPMFAGLLLRPHRLPPQHSARLGLLDFLLLQLWWLYLYISFVVCWQYVSPNVEAYNLNFDILSGAETVLFASVLAVFWRESSGRWRLFYGALCGVMVWNGIAFYALNHAIELDVYYSGSWFDIPYSGSFAGFIAVAALGYGLAPAADNGPSESYGSWVGNLAMLAVLSLPVIALYALLDPRLPQPAAHFRVLVTLATMFLMALLLFIQHRRLNRELRRSNWVLQEASLTDPLTGLRNRRYFAESIDADVSRVLRAYADGHDVHTRDLVFYLIDADDFKEVNDRYGHDIGDRVLVEMAQRLSSSIRHSDVLVRWGGEEFLIVSRFTDRTEAELLARRVLAAVADTPFTVGKSGETMSRTCSMGWAAFPWFPLNPHRVSYEEVLSLADRGLNQAKRTGKNRAVGMLPCLEEIPTASREKFECFGLEVEALAVAGPGSETSSRRE